MNTPRLTKKRYEEIAELIKGRIPHRFIFGFALPLADYFASKDKTFKKDLFLKQCGVKE